MNGDKVESLKLNVTRDQLLLINNALNEVCNGVEIADFEFHARLGGTRAEVSSLLEQIGQILKGHTST